MADARTIRGRGIAAGLLAAALAAPSAAAGATIPVGSTADSGGGCTLRSAILAADNNTAGGGCPAGQTSPIVDTIDLSGAGGPKITLGNSLPDIAEDVNIVGPGSAQLSVDGADMFHPFNVLSGKTASISGLTITGGLCDSSCGSEGGAILNNGTLTLTDVTVSGNAAVDSGATNSFAEGGGIENNGGGTLHLINSTVSDNDANASGASNQNGSSGGGIMARGTTTLDGTTVVHNDVSATGSGGASNANVGGGGIDVVGPITITRSTVSGNGATAQGGGTTNNADGGGIATFNALTVNLALDRSTVSGNSVTASGPGSAAFGGGIVSDGPTLSITSSTISRNSALLYSNLAFGAPTSNIKNTIISNPLGGGADCNAPNADSLGFNLEDTNTCGFGQATDKPSTNPMLDATLANNGGPTQTLALLAGSPAIDSGLSSVGETVDQRGLGRPSDFTSIANVAGGDGTDIGAFELQAPAPPTTTAPTGTPTTTTRKKCNKRKNRRAVAAKKKCKKRRR